VTTTSMWLPDCWEPTRLAAWTSLRVTAPASCRPLSLLLYFRHAFSTLLKANGEDAVF
jgi:hypothetical protein